MEMTVAMAIAITIVMAIAMAIAIAIAIQQMGSYKHYTNSNHIENVFISGIATLNETFPNHQ